MRILLITPTSVSIELINNDAYYTETYFVYLNDKAIGAYNINTFSIYDLMPGNSYNLEVIGKNFKKRITFKTLSAKPIILKPNNEDNHDCLIQNAIDHLAIDEFLVLEGQFNVTSIFLRSNTSIYIKRGTVLKGNNNREAFKILSANEYCNGIPLGTWEGQADDSFASIITGIGVSNCLIYGEGIIDCDAQNGDWWINHRVKRIARRPKGIFLHTCSNITLDGITVCNTPSWNQHAFYSKNIKYYCLKLLNPKNSPTTDGCDPESCTNVEMIGLQISVGDDCVAIKSGKIDFARKYHTPCSNVTIRNCLMVDGHGGVTIGSENSGGINNINVSQCFFKNTDRGLRIKSQRGRGNQGIIQGIIFDNIYMDNVLSPFVINAFYKAGNDEYDERFIRDYQSPSSLTPEFNEFSFSNIKCYNVSYGVGFFLGLPESPIKKVKLYNIDISFKPTMPGSMAMTAWEEKFANVGFVCENVNLLEIKGLNFLNNPSEKYILKNVKKIKEL